jgi:hypothetical protein
MTLEYIIIIGLQFTLIAFNVRLERRLTKIETALNYHLQENGIKL